MPVISVIVPVYNAGPYLRECVDGILSQTFSDFELILVDDGSADGSGEICEGYAKRDPRVTVFHQENAGQAAARNRGVRAARTDLICLIDSDDVPHPFLLEAFYRAICETGANAAVTGRVRGKIPPERFFEPVPIRTALVAIDEESLVRFFREDDTIYWTLFPCLIRKSIYARYPLTEGRVMEDNAVACKWLTAAGTVARIEPPLYFYRENPTGTMEAPFSEKKLDFLWALYEQMDFCEACGYHKLLGLVAARYVENAVWLAEKVRKELGDVSLARRVVRKAGRVRRANAAVLTLTPEQERKLFKAAHPVFHSIGKKCGNLRLRVKKLFGK